MKVCIECGNVQTDEEVKVYEMKQVVDKRSGITSYVKTDSVIQECCTICQATVTNNGSYEQFKKRVENEISNCFRIPEELIESKGDKNV